jgi:hypothetical protein
MEMAPRAIRRMAAGGPTESSSRPERSAVAGPTVSTGSHADFEARTLRGVSFPAGFVGTSSSKRAWRCDLASSMAIDVPSIRLISRLPSKVAITVLATRTGSAPHLRVTVIRVDGSVHEWTSPLQRRRSRYKSIQQVTKLVDRVGKVFCIARAHLKNKRQRIFQAFRSQFFFAGKMPVKSAFLEAGGIQYVLHRTSGHAALVEQRSGLLDDALPGLRSFTHG